MFKIGIGSAQNLPHFAEDTDLMGQATVQTITEETDGAGMMRNKLAGSYEIEAVPHALSRGRFS
jgi:hypothetical protein